nr:MULTISPECIES: DEAD/DEAH box helicase [unclassified Pseudovibrio]
MGMRPMQARVYDARNAQCLLLKAPPAAGKSRALMFLGLDKLINQGLDKVIVAVPERSIGSSFSTTDLTTYGFYSDWTVLPRWNLCTAGTDDGEGAKRKVQAVKDFMASDDQILVCTHATFRFAFEQIGADAFDSSMIAIDEFHHVSASEDNKLGEILRELVRREQAHIMAMTGSYFRGDTAPVLMPEDEAKFTSVTYSYYEQLDGYEHLKSLGIGYKFYRGNYIDALHDALDPAKKTIIHIPHVASAEAYDHKDTQVGDIQSAIGLHQGVDDVTGYDLIKAKDGRVLKVADLVNDDPKTRVKVMSALQNAKKRDAVDMIIALGMAKEGFDWPWCEHALTIGYRSSLTEIIQIIGRATRDAPGKPHAQFTNLIAEPAAEEGIVVDAVNDMLKAISGALLMEQVLAPNFKFHSRREGDEPVEPWRDRDGTIHVEIGGLMEPPTDRSKEIIEKDMQDLIALTCQTAGSNTLAQDVAPEVVTQMVMTEVIEKKFENLTDDESEAVRQHLAARMNVLQLAKQEARKQADDVVYGEGGSSDSGGAAEDGEEFEQDGEHEHHGLLKMVKKLINVRDLDIDLIDSVNPFRESFDVASKALDSQVLSQVQAMMVAQRTPLTEQEAVALWPRIKRFREQEGRAPNPNAADDLERRLGEAHAYIRNKKAEKMRERAEA